MIALLLLVVICLLGFVAYMVTAIHATLVSAVGALWSIERNVYRNIDP